MDTLIKLVKSLSGAEKRQFKMYCSRQSGDKYYLILFELIDAHSESALIRQKYNKKCPPASITHSARYLQRVIMDSLIQGKIEKDNFFLLLQEFMRARILRERALTEESDKQLINIRKTATKKQQHHIEYIACREQLDHITNSNFSGVSDSKLIEEQMHGKQILKTINHIHDHHSLFELLKYRLIYSGRIVAKDERKRLNDLMLSEMTLVMNKSTKSFASQKLHLLFQSYFFIDIGDYQSAVKVFHSLNKLFADNLNLLDNPPLDYLDALNGILQSLHMLGRYNDMHFYMEKLAALDQVMYPEYFRYLLRKTVSVYELIMLIGNQQYAAATEFVMAMDGSVLDLYDRVSEERQWELYFYCARAYAGVGNWKRSHLYISEVMKKYRAQNHWLICKAARLLNIIVYYERGDTDYLEYEVRSYKRFFKKNYKLLKSEELLLKYISILPDARRKRLPEKDLVKMKAEMADIEKDPYERQLLKHLDVLGWVSARII